MVQTVGVTTSEYAKANKDKLRKLVQARAKAVAFVYANPEETAKIVAKHYETDEKTILAAVNNLIAMKYWSDGAFEYDAMDNGEGAADRRRDRRQGGVEQGRRRKLPEMSAAARTMDGAVREASGDEFHAEMRGVTRVYPGGIHALAAPSCACGGANSIRSSARRAAGSRRCSSSSPGCRTDQRRGAVRRPPIAAECPKASASCSRRMRAFPG